MGFIETDKVVTIFLIIHLFASEGKKLALVQLTK